MNSTISDKSYWRLSDLSYQSKLPKYEYIYFGDNKEKWEVLNRKTNKGTGFNATAFKNGENIVIAFRGTEGGEPFGDGFKDIVTDARYIVFKQKDRVDKFPNQFKDGIKYVEEIKKKYPDKEITVTGHSLGGAIASYVAATESLEAVTYSAPSVIDILPDDINKKAEEGYFDKSIINYVHPQDSIGAGYFEEYDRHIGSTYYVGSRFEIENRDDVNNPISRFIDSATIYHKLSVFEFDKSGNLSNKLITNSITDKELLQSPRFINHPSVASTGNTIQVHPQRLFNYGLELERRFDFFRIKHINLKTKMLNHNHIKEAGDIEYAISSSLNRFHNWYEEEIILITRFIKETAKSIEEVDSRLSKEAAKFK